MNQAQTVQQPAPMGMNPAQGAVANPAELPKKSKWLLWVLIMVAIAVLGLAVWWLFTP